MGLKVKPKKHEILDFKVSEMVIDEKWRDLYEYEPKKKNKNGKSIKS